MSAAPSTSAMASPVMPRFYSAARLLRTLFKKTRANARVFWLQLRLAAPLDHPVDDLHLVAGTPARRRGLNEQALGAVLVTDDDLVLHGLFRVFLDRVSGEAAADHAKDGCNVLAPAAAHLMADDAADDRAADGPGARGLACFLDFAHLFDHRALAANCGDDGRGRRNDCDRPWRLRFYDRPRLRLDRRLRLGGLCFFGLRRGLLGCQGNGRACGAGISDRSRDPAENGSDSHEAEQRDRDRSDDDERMGLTCGLRFHGGLLLQGLKLTRNNARGARRLM